MDWMGSIMDSVDEYFISMSISDGAGGAWEYGVFATHPDGRPDAYLEGTGLEAGVGTLLERYRFLEGDGVALVVKKRYVVAGGWMVGGPAESPDEPTNAQFKEAIEYNMDQLRRMGYTNG